MKFHCILMIVLLLVLTTSVEKAHSDKGEDKAHSQPKGDAAEADDDGDVNQNGDGEYDEKYYEVEDEKEGNKDEKPEAETVVTGNEKKTTFNSSRVDAVLKADDDDDVNQKGGGEYYIEYYEVEDDKEGDKDVKTVVTCNEKERTFNDERCSSTAAVRPPGLCGAGRKLSRVDAVLKVGDSKYFFDDSTVYVFNGSTGPETKWICDLFPDGPAKVTGALYNERTRTFLLINSRKVYAFETQNDEKKLMENFPKHFDVSAPVTGAIYLEDRQFFILEGSLCGFYNEQSNAFDVSGTVKTTFFFGLMPDNAVGGYRTGETHVSNRTYGIYELFTRYTVWNYSRHPNSINRTSSIQEYFN